MFNASEVLTILVLFCVYGLIVFGLFFALRRFTLPAKIAILASFLIFGVLAGLISAQLWPQDISVMANFPASLIGDWIYDYSIQYIGDPSSAQAHYTIPWILRIPQAYVLASVLFWGLLGLLVQLVYNGRMRVMNRYV